MNNPSFKSLLMDWHKRRNDRGERIACTLELSEADIIKLDAFAETFQLDRNEVAASLLHLALREAEAKMPYIPGPRVIRMEEGEEIYEDTGPTPRYIAAQQKLTEALEKSSKIS